MIARVALAALAVAALVTGALAIACTDIPIGDGPRKTVVREVTSGIIAPRHAALAREAAALEQAVAALVAAPDAAALAAAQARWRAARTPWLEAMVFRTGPVKDDLFEARLDQWPVDERRIATEIAGTGPLTPDYVGSLGANKVGFHAVEILIFDATGGDAAVLAALTTDPLAERRRQYLAATATHLAREAAALDAAWDPARGGYATDVVDIGGAGPFATVKEAVDATVNGCVFVAELIAASKLGKPMGKATGGDPLPSLIESLPSDHAVDDMRAALRGLGAVYQGLGPGGGLSSLVARASPSIDARVRAELATLDAALVAIPRPFADAVVGRAPEVERAWESARRLQVLLATEVIAALGATLSLSDNDGD